MELKVERGSGSVGVDRSGYWGWRERLGGNWNWTIVVKMLTRIESLGKASTMMGKREFDEAMEWWVLVLELETNFNKEGMERWGFRFGCARGEWRNWKWIPMRFLGWELWEAKGINLRAIEMSMTWSWGFFSSNYTHNTQNIENWIQ